MLKRFEIHNLFGEYSYFIDWRQSSYKDLSYITGPNGMGKTTVLRMIAGLSSFNPEKYASIPFDEAVFTFDENEEIKLTRRKVNLQPEIQTDEKPVMQVILTCEYHAEKPMMSIHERSAWTYEEGHGEKSLVFVNSDIEKMTNMEMLLESDQCRFFADDRVFNALESKYTQKCIDRGTIKKSLQDLQMHLENDFVYTPDGIDIQEWVEIEKRKIRVLKVLDFLKECDIYIGGYEQYKKLHELGGADLIFMIKRFENAIRGNKEAIDKLQTYRKVMNRFRFVETELQLSPRYGYRLVRTNTNDWLQFDDLASGEKHLLCLMNGLFFVQTESQLVMIDEPEMSYHMYWQVQFCKTIKEIVKKLHLRVLIATHAPLMFDHDFSLTVDLWEQWDKQRKEK